MFPQRPDGAVEENPALRGKFLANSTGVHRSSQQLWIDPGAPARPRRSYLGCSLSAAGSSAVTSGDSPSVSSSMISASSAAASSDETAASAAAASLAAASAAAAA